MQIESLELAGLRAISNARLTFDDVTVLLGGNNAGKSTLLYALSLFFDAAPKVKPDDFHNRESDTIEITVTFKNLTPTELEEFAGGVHDGKLSISRTLSDDKDSNLIYSVRARSYPGFTPIRNENNKPNQRAAFNALADQTEGLERANNADQVIQNMKDWEAENPDQLEFMFIKSFFGASNVANGKLRKKTGLHFIPAVADVAEQTTDAKRSPIISLLSDIAKQTFENRQEVTEFIEKTNAEFAEIVAPDRFPQLAQISESLTNTIQRYYQDTKLLAEWQVNERVQFSFPQPVIRVEDHGFLSGLENVGHGLQRAALFAVIEFLARSAVVEEAGDFDEAQSDIILMIEEPEIYQHPHKQRLVSDAFRNICNAFNRSTGIRFQVIFATHSDKFVDVGHFQNARIVRRRTQDGALHHSISTLELSEAVNYFAGLLDVEPMAVEAFQAKMHIFSRELCEGFFAEKIILVEGVTDRAVIEGCYRANGRDNIAEGIVVISVDGKTKMDKPFYIFNRLGIPTYAVFDSDATKSKKRQKPQTNLLLQKIANVAEPVDFPDCTTSHYAAFGHDLEGYLRSVCGENWEATFLQIAGDYDLDVTNIAKTPMAVAEVISRLRNDGHHFPAFDSILEHVDNMIALDL
ncbi:AAA family ATPase [Sulfitobacter sp.]|uniref:AAA family ATPase n=1 Tax=Sulfitobacter sp. TaxID=1903071 RepID=UPI0030011C48